MPEYLFYGMTENEFWKGNPYLAKSYRELYKIKQESDNYKMWLQGMYIHEGVAIAIGNALRKKGAKISKYPSKPYSFKKQETADVDQAREEAISQLNALCKKWNKNG